MIFQTLLLHIKTTYSLCGTDDFNHAKGKLLCELNYSLKLCLIIFITYICI